MPVSVTFLVNVSPPKQEHTTFSGHIFGRISVKKSVFELSFAEKPSSIHKLF